MTLAEIVVVGAIVAILTTVALAWLGSTRSNSRDVQRKRDLKTLQAVVEAYFAENRTYPVQASFTGDSTSPTYIPGIAPSYMPSLPRDPSGGASNNSAPACSGQQREYQYRSDGASYKLISHCAPEGTMSASDMYYDPIRPTWAWAVCSDKTTCDTW